MFNFFKKAKPHKRFFQAAKLSNLTSSWQTSTQAIQEPIKRQLKILRARAREQAVNNDYARKFLNLCKTNIIGPQGIRLQARLKTNQELNQALNQKLEQAWQSWGQAKYCDITGQLSWLALQQLIIQTIAQDGEVLIRLIPNATANPYGLALQLLDAELLDVDLNLKLDAKKRISMGIELNTWGKPTAYYLLSETGETQHFGKAYQRIPANEIIHAYLPEQLNQRRGLPWMSTALWRMKMLGGYEDSAITAARVGAAKMGFFRSPTGEGYAGSGMDDNGNLVSSAEPGTFEQLPAGTEFVSFNPEYPHGEFGTFMKTCLRGIASGLLVSYNSLANDLEGVNFSSIRSGLLEERDSWKLLQQWFIDAVCQPILENWLKLQRLTESVPLPLECDPFHDFYWQPRRWSWVDPVKEVQAQRLEVELGTRSISDIIRESGRDPEEVFLELIKDKAQFEAAGLSVFASKEITDPHED
jgi:lambda family phage portal protein